MQTTITLPGPDNPKVKVEVAAPTSYSSCYLHLVVGDMRMVLRSKNIHEIDEVLAAIRQDAEAGQAALRKADPESFLDEMGHDSGVGPEVIDTREVQP